MTDQRTPEDGDNDALRAGYNRANSIPSISDVARECFKLAKGDRHAAVTDMQDKVLHGYRFSKEPYVSFVESLIKTGVEVEINLLHRGANARVRRSADGKQAETGYRVHALATGNALMMFRLPSGYLRDATKKEVYAAAEMRGKQATTLQRDKRFLLSVGRGLDGKKTVSACFTETQLRNLWQKAKDEK